MAKKKNTKQLYKLQNCLFSPPPWGWYSWFWTLRGKPQEKKNALHLELEWVKLAHFCHEFLLILLKIHSYINNFAIQNSGAKYKVVPSSALTGQWYGTYHTSGFVCKVLWDIDLNTHFRRDRVIEVSSSWKLIVPQTREYLKIYVPWHLTVKKQTNKWKQPTYRTF